MFDQSEDNPISEQVEAAEKKVLAVYPAAFAHQLIEGPWAIFISGNQEFGTIKKWSHTEDEAWIEFASRIDAPVEPKAQVESASVECPVCHKPSGDYENPKGCWHNVNSKDEIENIDAEPKEIKSGLPPIPEPSTNYVNVTKWELGWRREQLKASLLREKRQAEEVERLKGLLKQIQLGTRHHPAACSPDGDFKCKWCREVDDIKAAVTGE